MNNMLKKLGLAGLLSASQQKVDQPFPQSPLPATHNDYAHTTVNAPSKKIIEISKKIKNVFKNSKLLLFIVIGIIVVTTAYITISNLTKSQSKTVAGIQDNKITIQNAKASQELNKEFLFPLKDAKGKEISKLKYSIQKAELRDEIIVKGQKATAIKGRTFLILNLKITNDYEKSIQISARDYLRLTVNNSSEKLAPDIHNDPVEIQAISTKFTRLGFPINDTDKNLTLQVGEIDGKKELIKLNLK